MKKIPQELIPLWNQLSDFVQETCKDRDASHGYEHMRAVANSSFLICSELFELHPETHSIFRTTIIVAWLHDVADHKYDFDGRLKEKRNEFLIQHFPYQKDLIDKIITRISYSNEVKERETSGTVDWHKVLGKDGLIIRDIVSDADKLEALGLIGLKRCIEYTKHAHRALYNDEMPSEKVVDRVKRHALEKLLQLKDHYIRTEPGKKRAIPLHEELEKGIKHLEENPWLYI